LPGPSPAGEVNGKSNNLNNCLLQLYPKGTTIPMSEVLFILDADMVPNQTFFVKLLEVMQVKWGPEITIMSLLCSFILHKSDMTHEYELGP
jgi:hypothetical protein